MTVRVTAAVYQGFLRLKPHFTHWHWAGIRDCTNLFRLAVSVVFVKQSSLPCYCDLQSPCEDHRHCFFRSYAANLPSSLDRVGPTHLRLLSVSTCDGSWYGCEGSFQTRFSRAPGIDRTLHTQSYSCIHLLLLITRLQRFQQLTCVCLS